MQTHAGLRAVLVVTAFAFCGDAFGDVTRIDVTSKEQFGSFARGDFIKYELRVAGDLSPEGESVPDLSKAKRNARGRVQYETHVTLIAPANEQSGNGTLLIDIPNRSRATALAIFNSPRAVPLPLGPTEPGNGFLQDQGFTVATVYWELAKGVRLPSISAPGGQPLYIEGAALPMVRDIAAFLARKDADDSGTANPLRKHAERTIAFGYSQSGRFLKSLLIEGDNRAEGRRVFDGMLILGAASGRILLRTHEGDESQAGAVPTFADPELRGVLEAPDISIAQLVASVIGRGEQAPKMIFVNTTTDYFSLRASLGRTGIGSDERPVPSNVRMYDIAGGSHALVAGKSSCSMPFGRLDWHPVLRATLLMMDAWVSRDVPPPPNELMPLEASSKTDPLVLRAPQHLSEAVIKVPVRDADGVAVGGIRLPDVEAPLGSNAVQNPPLTFLCALTGGFKEFKKTPAERQSASDNRLSIAERYTSREEYVAKVRAATLAAQKRGFLLPADAAVIVDDAYAADLPAAK